MAVPMKVAMAYTAASGRTYPVMMAPGAVGSAATTSHSVLGVTIMFFARSIKAMRCSFVVCRGSASVNKVGRGCDNCAMADIDNLVEIRDLHFAYGRRPVLR